MQFVVLAAIYGAAVSSACPAFGQTQSAMNSSAAQSAKKADQALNAQYRMTAGKISVPTRLLLRDAQRSWISFRDQECRFASAGAKGGSAYPMIYSGCLKRLTEERTRQLKSHAQCEEGDLSCSR
ncbi:lysozyme inhibitor LprI family protein [Sphingomonas paeninsulae]